MATADSSALDDFLNSFRTQVDSGFGLISGDVQIVFGCLVLISVGLTAVMWIIDESATVTAAFIRKVLAVGFFSWLITSWQTLSTLVVQGFASLGLQAGAGNMSLANFLSSPSKVVGDGFGVAFQILKYIGQLSQQDYGLGFFSHFDVILVASLCTIGIIIAFIILAVEIAVTIIEFHIVSLIAFVTVPFGVLSHTTFMSERAIGYVISIGVKLMALALVVSIGESVFESYTVSALPTAAEECGLFLAAVLMLMLAVKVPAVAGGLISGGPQLTAGSATAGAASVAATVGGLMFLGRSAASMALSSPLAAASGRSGAVAAAHAAAGLSDPAPVAASGGGASSGAFFRGGPSNGAGGPTPPIDASDGPTALGSGAAQGHGSLTTGLTQDDAQ
jgi:type IV secretion system protein TrbL